MLATLVLTTLLCQEKCSACSTSALDVRLCEAHSAEERTVMTREAKRLGSKEVNERVAALGALAALTQTHVNAPSERVAQRLAAALEDDSPRVRTCAAELLGRPQHALVCLAALTDALARTDKQQSKLNDQYDSFTAQIQGNPTDKKRMQLENQREKVDAERRELATWRKTLAARLGDFPDDRAVDALLAHTARNLLVSDHVALAKLGSKAAMRAVAEAFAGAEQNLVKLQADVDEIGRSGKEITMRFALAQKILENGKKAVDKAREDIRAQLAERGLTPPTATEKVAEAWRAWVEANLASFPEHLPGLSSPAW